MMMVAGIVYDVGVAGIVYDVGVIVISVVDDVSVHSVDIHVRRVVVVLLPR